MILVCLLAASATAKTQSIGVRLSQAFAAFENDPQLKSAIASLYVLDEAGTVVFQKAGNVGLAPASTQKIITAATTYQLLGKDFRYETKFGYYGAVNDGKLDGGLYVKPSGDPTLGSWRWQATTEDEVVMRLVKALRKTGIKTFPSLLLDQQGWEAENIPGGWIWDDVGNYYGAGAGVLNWRENQYDLFLKSGPTVRDAVIVTGTKPHLYGVYFRSQVKAAGKGTGDNSYIYLPVGGNLADVRGTIPYGEDRFTISGAMPSPLNQFLSTLHDSLRRNGYTQEWNTVFSDQFSKVKMPAEVKFFHVEQSPPLDSIVFWFLRKSINLYGEALAKTMARQKGKTASAAEASDLIRDYWKEKGLGIHSSELNLHDGSGLSPQNRVTTHALALVLHHAKNQPWFAGYFNGFPTYNGMRLKSGTIGGAKGFCGYHTAKDGTSYTVAFIVNNYDGSSASVVQKMYKVLDVLK